MPQTQISSRVTQIPEGRVLSIAQRQAEEWLADANRSGIARQQAISPKHFVDETLARVKSVLAHENCAKANRQWLCDAVRAWAPLEVIFPSRPHQDKCGVSGQLHNHAALILEREYGHILATVRSVPAAIELLRSDAQRLDLEISVGRSLLSVIEEAPDEQLRWLESFSDMSLAMSEYLHRHAIGLAQVLSDAAVMSYTTIIARTQRELRQQCFAPAVIARRA